ncbi:polysaccharide deacetylase family protein [Luteolibacter flavescens]|uniref:Polysaccharide deacetylase family protein n=1 Tax=Luteolibacter flavescens TaxID=1859460 RepID=A0ABT3FUX2_9BACT|nr:polysaccharide deacetylase family protein [Luteolibacter flavescens]MCW1887396.1 polysaccharide deacetylase family protein [Luteolibacter flavescens]
MLEKDRPNRAVTPFFQIFGGRWQRLSGDAIHMTEGAGHHRLEWRVLSVLVPLVAGAAVFDALWRIGGAWLAWGGVLPVLFLLFHIVAIVIGGKNPLAQWQRWNLLLAAWSVWQGWFANESGVRWAAGIWLGVLALNAVSALCLGWRFLMVHPATCTAVARWFIFAAIHVPVFVVTWLYGWHAGLVVLPVAAAVWLCGTFLPNSRVFGPIARRVEGKDVLLTIDDGPDPVDTPALLDLLDQHGRRAVFFIIGEKVRRHPELAREIVRRGHELGNHTMTHPVGVFWGLGPARTRREIEGCQQAIEEATGTKARFFRAPAGHRNWFTHPALQDLGLELVGWRKRAYDTIRSDVDGIVRDLVTGVKDGDILLLHEATMTSQGVMKGVLEALESGTPRVKKTEAPDHHAALPDS